MIIVSIATHSFLREKKPSFIIGDGKIETNNIVIHSNVACLPSPTSWRGAGGEVLPA
jgi:hypothetical protein